MNLFITSTCPKECAEALDDKRLGKMLMETNQLLSSALHFHWNGYFIDPIDDHVGEGMICKLTHANHPCAVWVRGSKRNFYWTIKHSYALGHEWTYRFDSFHSSSVRTQYIHRFYDCLPSGDLLPFQNSARNDGLGLDFTWLPVPVSYQEYLLARWKTDKRPATWTRRGAPSWVQKQ
jgi:hypothetical protein